MSLIHARFLVRVAGNAGEDGVVVRVGMAIAASGPHSRVAAGVNGEPGVIEVCALPTRGGVTRGARGGEMRCNVIGIVRALIVRLVARIAIRRGMNVIVVDVAAGTRNFHVGAGKGKFGLVVVEGRRLPGRSVVTNLARRGESSLQVRRIVRALVILHVTTGARGTQATKISIQMAALTLQFRVRAGESEPGAGVIEDRIRPRCGVVADRTVSGESCLGVVRVRRFLVVLQVARAAILGDIRVVVVDMAAGAGRIHVCPGQREPGECSVIKLRLQPRVHVVARGTGGRKCQPHVIRILRSHVVLHVTAHAIRGRPLVLSSDVALGAFQIGVRPHQSKSREAQVIEFGAQPRVHVAVAHLTLRGETQGNVIGPGGLPELFHVAADAIGGQPLELPNSRTGVAGITLQRGMGSDQREPVLMLLNLADCHPPSVHRMALLASRSKLPPVDVGMAVRAFRTDLRKDQVGVALATCNLLVHPPEGIAGLVVVEFRDAADRLPSGKRMAILARDGQVAVRTAAGDIRPRVLTTGGERAGLSGLGCGRREDCHPHEERYCREHGVHLLVLN